MRKKIFFLIIIGLLIFYRIVFYSADPFHTSWSTGAYTDIGFYLHNARHHYLFNTPVFGSWDNRFLFPAYHYYYLFLFKIFGLNKLTLQINLVVIQIIIVFFIFKIIYYIYKDYKIAYLTIFIYSYNFNLIRNNRIPFLENLMILFFIISFYFLIQENKKAFFLAGIFYSLSLMSKTMIIFLLPSYLIYFLFRKKNELLFFILGFLICLILWFLLMLKTDYSILYYTIFNKPISSNYSFYSLFYRIFNVFNTNIFMRMPIIFYSVLFHLIFILLTKIKLNRYQIFLISSFLFSHIFIVFSYYNPDRYYLLIITLYLFIFADFLDLILNNRKIIVFNKINLIKIILFLVILYIISYNNVWVFYRSILNFHIKFIDLIRKSFLIILLNIALFSLFYFFIKKSNKIFTIILIIIISFILNNYQFYQAIKNRSYVINEIQEFIFKNIKEDQIISGWWSPTLALFSKAKILPIYNEEDYEKYNINYIILENQTHLTHFKNKELIKIKDFYIGYLKKYITIYKIKNNINQTYF